LTASDPACARVNAGRTTADFWEIQGIYILDSLGAHWGADTIGAKRTSKMPIDVEGELQKATDNMHEAMDSLLGAGFPEGQLEHLNRYVQSAIAHSHWAIAKANREIKNEGTFQKSVS
jgi:hypothetical protein